MDDSPDAELVERTLGYLDQRGYQRMSYERMRLTFAEEMTDEALDEFVARNATVFRPARIKGGKPGLAKVLP